MTLNADDIKNMTSGEAKQQLLKEHGYSHVGMLECFICHEATGVLLDKTLKNSLQQHNTNPTEICNKCKEKYLKDGVMMIEAEKTNNHEFKNKWNSTAFNAVCSECGKQRKGHDGVKFSGNMAIIKDEAFKKIFNAEIPEKKICYCEIGLLQKIGAIKP